MKMKMNMLHAFRENEDEERKVGLGFRNQWVVRNDIVKRSAFNIKLHGFKD